MSEDDGAQGNPPEAGGASEAEDFLRKEFARGVIVASEHGMHGMREGQRAFDDAWGTAIHNATRLFGKSATRQALKAMGRDEDHP